MKLNSSNLTVVTVIAVAAIGGAFWMLGLSPKREEASKLDEQVTQAKASLAQHRSEIAAAEEAKEQFPVQYQRLVVLGKAVPGDDDTASLLVQVNRIADDAKVRFRDLEFEAADGTETETSEAPTTTSATGEPVSPTEAAAATMPLGASVGPAGLAVMPYTLTFDGSFFTIADFIKGLDSLVDTGKDGVTVDGRLLTINGFTLEKPSKGEFPSLEATFSVTTYLTPPGQAPTTAGEAPEAAATAEALPAATTTGVAR